MRNPPPIEDLWQQRNFRPNNAQEEAIRHVDGPLLITAGPGSGKTRVLLWRTLNLMVYHGVQPEAIFLGTFTEKAAFQLREGLRGMLAMVTNATGQPFDISKMAIGTVHSICNQILADRRITAGTRNIAPKVLDQLDQYLLVYRRSNWAQLVMAGGYETEEDAQQLINRHLGNKNSSSRHDAVVNMLALFNRFSEEHLDIAALHDVEADLLPYLQMYEAYHEMLKAQNSTIPTVDLSLLQLEAYQKICNPDGQSRYRHVIVDEYQDTNAIQEKIFFELAKGTRNICVVGDDDQALYRFRGATVENLVEFDQRCRQYLETEARRISLDINYRSRSRIVDTYGRFINLADWQRVDGNGHYRVHDKNIEAHSNDDCASVAVTGHDKVPVVGIELAQFILRLRDEGKISDFNQVAFLFPAMKGNSKVQHLQQALEDAGIPVYAPRAGVFLRVDECKAIFGLFACVFGRPPYNYKASGSMKYFQIWVGESISFAKEQILAHDKQLQAFVDEKREELKTIEADFVALTGLAEKRRWDLGAPATLEQVQEMARHHALSEQSKRTLNNNAFRKALKARSNTENPFSLSYVINRTTSVDWSLLDLFYRLCGFRHFKQMFDQAEAGTDEGPICNLALISGYIARFMEQNNAVITARNYTESRLVKVFFNSYLYALFRLQESEYENVDDPFPRGRVPFLTIHQAKGLEFPYVVLGSPFKKNFGASMVEEIVRGLLGKEGEPLDRIGLYDQMRMFYVGLSRAQHLLILPRYKGQFPATDQFKELFANNDLPELADLDLNELPEAAVPDEDLGSNYSYTADYLQYQKCPRQYMIFRKYGFVPSRSQTMFFGSLVHRTIEDLHNFLIDMKKQTPQA